MSVAFGIVVLVASTIVGSPLLTATASAPSSVEQKRDIQYGTDRGDILLLDIYMPSEPASEPGRPAVIMVHGGGWSNGDKVGFHAQAEAIAQLGWVAVPMDYHMSPPAGRESFTTSKPLSRSFASSDDLWHRSGATRVAR